jgi:hypothetical protein
LCLFLQNTVLDRILITLGPDLDKVFLRFEQIVLVIDKFLPLKSYQLLFHRLARLDDTGLNSRYQLLDV